MLATNFEKNFIPKINRVLEFALENKYSDFYRKKYENKVTYPIESIEDFLKIPLLTKNEILAVDINKRIFVPRDNIAYYSFTSGTTTNNKPTIIPHASFDRGAGVTNSVDEALLSRLGVTTLLILQNPLSPGFFKIFKTAPDGIIVIPGDTHNLKLSAQIIKEIAINGIKTSPTILYFFISYLREINFDFTSITYISLGGEFCSSQRADFFREVFPNAYLFFRYASSESDVKGYRCDALATRAPNLFHLNPHLLTEIVDENSKIVPLGTEGEIINTNLNTMEAFPFIRYKTGDIGSLSLQNCPCGNNLVLTLGGRSGTDVLKFHGVTIHADRISSGLSNVSEYLEPLFEMHVFEEKFKSQIKPKLQLHICLKKQYREKSLDPLFIEIATEKISSNLSLSSTNTLKSLVEQGVFLPLELVFRDSWEESQVKQKPIISHIQ